MNVWVLKRRGRLLGTGDKWVQASDISGASWVASEPDSLLALTHMWGLEPVITFGAPVMAEYILPRDNVALCFKLIELLGAP